jgi:23S rRNA (uridine2552-2'-O)-methyltransferase
VAYERKDVHYRRAKAAGYRARSAYKLIELDHRHRVLRAGDVVADLGSWPGAWLQVAAERVLPGGRVVGIDLVRVDPLGPRHVTSLVGDVRDPAAIAALADRLGEPATVIISDLAPKLTGIRDTDEARATELGAATLDVARRLLRPGGRLVMKAFMSGDFRALIARLRDEFEDVKTTKPEATRRGSSELYVIANGYRPSCG